MLLKSSIKFALVGATKISKHTIARAGSSIHPRNTAIFTSIYPKPGRINNFVMAIMTWVNDDSCLFNIWFCIADNSAPIKIKDTTIYGEPIISMVRVRLSYNAPFFRNASLEAGMQARIIAEIAVITGIVKIFARWGQNLCLLLYYSRGEGYGGS